MTKPEIVRAWCAERVGCPYVYGGTGQPCTPEYRAARAAQYPAYAEKIKRNCPRMKGSAAGCDGCVWYDQAAGKGKPAYDCAQLSRRAMEAVGIPMVSGANSQWERTKWAKHGDLADLPNDLFDKVFLVFRYDADKGGMGHVGVYQGDGTVIHAKGHDYGVVRQNIDDAKFTHWGIPAGLYGEEQTVNHPILRFGASGDDVIYLQTLLCDVGETLSADGKFGQATEKAVRDFQRLYSLTVDGVVGPKTWAALEAATGHQGDQADPQEDPQEDPPADEKPTITITKSDWDTIRAGYAAVAGILKKYEV